MAGQGRSSRGPWFGQASAGPSSSRTSFPRPASEESADPRERFAGLISRRRMQHSPPQPPGRHESGAPVGLRWAHYTRGNSASLRRRAGTAARTRCPGVARELSSTYAARPVGASVRRARLNSPVIVALPDFCHSPWSSVVWAVTSEPFAWLSGWRKLPMSGGGWVLLGERPREEDRARPSGEVLAAGDRVRTSGRGDVQGVRRAGVRQDDLRARDAPDRGRRDAPVGDHAHCDHRTIPPAPGFAATGPSGSATAHTCSFTDCSTSSATTQSIGREPDRRPAPPHGPDEVPVAMRGCYWKPRTASAVCARTRRRRDRNGVQQRRQRRSGLSSRPPAVTNKPQWPDSRPSCRPRRAMDAVTAQPPPVSECLPMMTV